MGCRQPRYARGTLADEEAFHMMPLPEVAGESAFCAMMNKLAFGRKAILQNLQDGILCQNS